MFRITPHKFSDFEDNVNNKIKIYFVFTWAWMLLRERKF